MLLLRQYQENALRALFTFWRNGGGNPLLALATGTAKSVVIAFLIRRLLTDYPNMRVLVSAPNRELIDQDVAELLRVWPDAPIGINCDGLGFRDTETQILFVSINLIYRNPKAVGLGRRAWLVVCVGITHAELVRDALRARGVDCEMVVGETNSDERDLIIEAFRAGRLTALVSVMVLSYGFNVPHVDLICMLRPTCSAGLYVQQVGRDTRKAPEKTDCLVLDFAGNVRRFGPVDNVRINARATARTARGRPRPARAVKKS
jgi:superfamily II DNA or RNA helicase